MEIGVSEKTFGDKVRERWARRLFLCVGLDSSLDKLPGQFKGQPPEEALFEFNRQIIEATAEYAATYKPNSAFYEQSGPAGMEALKRTCDWLHTYYPEIPILIDAKRGDMESTNEAYARAIFDYYEADAVTVQPYLGAKALAPFLDRPEKTSFVLCRTSNPDSAEIQELEVAGEPLYLKIARLAAGPKWNRHRNVGLVTGATYPTDLGRIRAVAPDLPLLVPGIGAQGGEIGPVLNYGLDAAGEGVIISASRSIIYASSGPDFAEAARREAAHLARAMQQGQQEVMEKRRKI